MQKILTYTTFALLFTTTGCKKFLDQSPDNRATLATPEQVSQLLGTAYPQANYMAFCESISDNVADKGKGVQDKTNVDPYFFRDVTDNQQDSPEYYWNACYTAIAAANQALEVIKNSSDTTRFNAQKGEALVCRAYAHFMLVTFFSKVYNPNTAASDLGIPYVTSPETIVFKQYDRKTVAYVYQMIEQDLTRGLPLIDDTKYTVPRYHFTKAAANAFATRFYLFKGDFAKVLNHANAVFTGTDIVSKLRPWNTTYLTYSPQEMFTIYQKATEPANLLLCETGSVWGRNFYTVRYSLNPDKRDEILGRNVCYPSDADSAEWAFRYQTYTAGTDNVVIPKINEYFVRSSVNANIGLPYVMVPLFTSEEVLFNRIEANIYLNSTNANAAIADLNTYASTRIKNYKFSKHEITPAKLQTFYGQNNVRVNALLALLDFKRAEYIHEGMRWFDLLRYPEDFPVVHTTTDGQSFSLTADDPRRVFQLPESVKQSGMPLNPR
jgi:hypothetical protein